VITIQFNSNMKGLLLQLKSFFTEYNLIEYISLPSIYSQKLFEILKSWKNKKEIYIKLNELQNLLNIPDSLYKDFAQFRRRVLDKAHNDILSKTDFYFEWEPIKKGKAVDGIRFIFDHKLALSINNMKTIEKNKKISKKNMERFKKFMDCYKKYGAPCEGGHQKEEICDICKRLR
ncbi:MAG: replication initiation protein, partial [Lactobacillus sp.]|nr:replication initiation protein [Lactobacillus sp.]